METETYEQITLNKGAIGDPAVFLQDGMTVTVQSYEGRRSAWNCPTAWSWRSSRRMPL